MSRTKIEWTETAWNPLTGCTPVSPACEHCYARRMAKRLAGRCGYPPSPREFNVTLHLNRLGEPLTWRKSRRVFVVSMGDLFHAHVPDEFIYKIFAVMALCPQHTFQVLTKRPQRMFEFMQMYPQYQNLNNVVGMVTAEDQQCADERIPWLLKCQFVTRGVSAEPLLERVDLTRYMQIYVDPHTRKVYPLDPQGPKLDWVICGGETGPGARLMHPDWARSLRDQCQAAGVAFFFKAWGDCFPSAGRLLDGRTRDEYPVTHWQPLPETGDTETGE